MLDFLSGAMPAYIDTGPNVVNVRDVAFGHLLACEKGSGRRALYPWRRQSHLSDKSCRNWRVSRGRKAPTIELHLFRPPGPPERSPPLGRISTGVPPRVPLEAVRMAKKKMWVSHEKAARELGYSPCPATSVLRGRCSVGSNVALPILSRRVSAR